MVETILVSYFKKGEEKKNKNVSTELKSKKKVVLHITIANIFFLASSTSVYFFGKLLTWIAWKIKPENFKKEISNKDILTYNEIIITVLILWSILFYFKLHITDGKLKFDYLYI